MTDVPVIASERERAIAPNATVCVGDQVFFTHSPRKLHTVVEDQSEELCVFVKTLEGKDGTIMNKVVLNTVTYGTEWCKPLRTVEFPHEYTKVDGIFQHALNPSKYAAIVKHVQKLDFTTDPLEQLAFAVGDDKWRMLIIGPGIDPEIFELAEVENLELVVCQGERGDSFNCNSDKKAAVALQKATTKLKIPTIYVNKEIAYLTKMNCLQMKSLNEFSEGFYEKIITIGCKGFRDNNRELFNSINWPGEFIESEPNFMTCSSTDTLWYNALDHSPPLYDLTAFLLAATFTFADLSTLENEWYKLAKDETTADPMCYKVVGFSDDLKKYRERILAELEICFEPPKVKIAHSSFVAFVVLFLVYMIVIV